MELNKIDDIIEKYRTEDDDRGPNLIPILQDIQAEYGWLPEEAFIRASRILEIPMVKLYGVATFYNEFRLQPVGKNHITVCMGTACHVRGAGGILAEFERQLGIKAGEISPDHQFSLDTAMCIGCCAVAPVITANDEYHGSLTKKDVKPLIEKLRQGEKVEEDVKN